MAEYKPGSIDRLHRVRAAVADMREEGFDEAPLLTQVLRGEGVRITHYDSGWCRVVAELDGYEGYVRYANLVEANNDMTHRVSERSAIVYAEPDFKQHVLGMLYMNSLVEVCEEKETPEGAMCRVPDLGWIFKHRLRWINEYGNDHVAEMLKLQGIEYGWGYRGMAYDCSAATQAACIACNIDCPRDSIPQSKALGELLDPGIRRQNLRSGDFAFWTSGNGRHVALVINRELDCVHAKIMAPYGRVVRQPLEQIEQDQLRDGNGPITVFRRIPGYQYG